ncbi:lytic murein transglycosylase [Roseivivax lentus]|uniref:Lytic murein transglycosylase n=1 Tax=Roseivivax lentus TaxID=633194 RepID=A0A1N7MEN1_9RHOB|nr:lytic murein transglycosylase [Roseivivax lentus]SIS84518.1 lytic murein transglycosylase [Roseivivax lentus]
MLRALAVALALTASCAHAETPCGGSFSDFLAGLKAEALDRGIAPATADRFLASVQQSRAVLNRDRQQGFFQAPFLEFSRKLISQNRLERGLDLARQYDAIFDRIEAEYGISRGVLLAFWAFETDYGAFQGDFNTADALVTLAHDCRRPEIFRPQVFAAMELFAQGAFDPARTTGAWAGEIGMVQMLPEDILENGRDGDGDGRVDLKTSAQDALMSGAAMLADLGWRPGEAWIEEVRLPEDFDWYEAGLETEKSVADWAAMGVEPRDGGFDGSGPGASIVIPQGRNGPAFIAYPNFRVYFEWNQSFTYVMTAAYFATRLEGAPIYEAGSPSPGLSGDEMVALQERLQARGYDVGGADGILGAGTRAAVRDVQRELGLPADAWPTRALLNRL